MGRPGKASPAPMLSAGAEFEDELHPSLHSVLPTENALKPPSQRLAERQAQPIISESGRDKGFEQASQKLVLNAWCRVLHFQENAILCLPGSERDCRRV